MKKILVFTMMAAVCMLLFAACNRTETLPKRFDSFVEKVEKQAASYSEDDWAKANDQFNKLVQEFKDNKTAFNEDQQKQIRADISKYFALVTKSGVNSAINAVNEVLNTIPNLIEGVGNFFKDLLTNPDGEKTE